MGSTAPEPSGLTPEQLRSKRYYAAHKEQRKANARRWAAANPDKVRAYRQVHKRKNAVRNRQKHRDFRAFFRALRAAGACRVCGLPGRGNEEVMEFHHYYAPKEQPLGRMSNANRRRFLWEYMKCVQTCANCHLRLHAGTAPGPSQAA